MYDDIHLVTKFGQKLYSYTAQLLIQKSLIHGSKCLHCDSYDDI